ncbi:MAG: acyl-CoA dehydrogenase family protein [Deltaproteobacteria bacterium]|nr:acyl-CoA dehydrogenase family protein [Deltaproteobacteria bacterium]MBW2387207.1 acyl-CoA dehydrogenase family protein [Deltaproteobacteria bacterium]
MGSLESFRDEVRGWLAENCAEDVRVGSRDRLARERFDEWVRALGSKGWAAPGWPTEYGGGGLDREHQAVLAQEMRAIKAPAPGSFGLTMLGPTILELGTEEQKREHIPPITRHEIIWCQGYSEPGAGSDLAGVQTRAVLEGDEYVVTGQKIWTTGATHADWIFCLVRTDPDAPKHEGISFLLFPMKQKGVEVSPIRLIDGSEHFAQVFFDGARAKTSDVIGPVNGGWTVAKHLLQHERGVANPEGRAAGAGKRKGLIDLAREQLGMRENRLADPALRERIAQHELDSQAFGLTMRRAAEEARAGQAERQIASMSKFYWSELGKREQDIAMQLLGSRGLGWSGEGFEDAEIERTRRWLITRADSIWGGTSEIQRNIIAKRVLLIPE